jgi:glycosyltransferase involved in cell wall biosynthesis
MSAIRVISLATHEHTGAGRAAARTHAALARAGADSRLLVLQGSGGEPGIEVLGGPLRRRIAGWRWRAEQAALGLQRGGEDGYRSLGFGGPGLARIRSDHADVVHLHWIPGLLGIADLPAIRKPLVWTFHDAWPICGAEHYTALARPREGYAAGNRARGAAGPDIDRWVWQRKRAHWRGFAPLIVCSSRWMAAEVRASVLFQGCEAEVLPNPLDTGLYRPQDRAAARRELGLPEGRTLLLFGAWGVAQDRRKGFHVLAEALGRLAAQGHAQAADLVLAGASGNERVQGFATHWMGYVSDEARMRLLYAACDVLALPSLHDNYPNMLAEGMACGLCAVASDVGGIPDLVQHGVTGLLAPPGDAAALAAQLALALGDGALRRRLADAGRQAVAQACDERTVAQRYLALYRRAIEEHRAA